MEYRSFCLTIVIVAAFGASVFDISVSGLENCRFSGASVWHPGKDCTPKNCTSSKWPYQCDIRNYNDFYPDACEDAKKMTIHHTSQRRQSAPSRSTRSAELKEPPEPCLPKLSKLGLYIYSCLSGVIDEPVQRQDEISLKFSFHPPYCDGHVPDTAIMAEFNARNDSRSPYFMVHQICRVFNYSSEEAVRSVLTNEKRADWHEISYDCIGIGLRFPYPEIYYYLGLTALPSGALTNYTLVFLDVSKQSMRLVGAAWLSPSKIHVVFFPIIGVANYSLVAKSGNWQLTKTVNAALPEVEFSDIPQTINVVTVYLKPSDEQGCAGKTCGGINITLHSTVPAISAPLHSHPDGNTGSTQSSSTKVMPVVLGVAGTALVIIIIIVFLVRRHKHHTRQKRDMAQVHFQKECPVFVLGPSLSGLSDIIPSALSKKGFLVKTMRDPNCDPHDVAIYSGCKAILIVFDENISSVEADKEPFERHMRAVFNFTPAWNKIKVIQFASKKRYPSHLLKDVFRVNAPAYSRFTQRLDKCETFMWPKENHRLFRELRRISDEVKIIFPNSSSHSSIEVEAETDADQLSQAGTESMPALSDSEDEVLTGQPNLTHTTVNVDVHPEQDGSKVGSSAPTENGRSYSDHTPVFWEAGEKNTGVSDHTKHQTGPGRARRIKYIQIDPSSPLDERHPLISRGMIHGATPWVGGDDESNAESDINQNNVNEGEMEISADFAQLQQQNSASNSFDPHLSSPAQCGSKPTSVKFREDKQTSLKELFREDKDVKMVSRTEAHGPLSREEEQTSLKEYLREDTDVKTVSRTEAPRPVSSREVYSPADSGVESGPQECQPVQRSPVEHEDVTIPFLRSRYDPGSTDSPSPQHGSRTPGNVYVDQHGAGFDMSNQGIQDGSSSRRTSGNTRGHCSLSGADELHFPRAFPYGRMAARDRSVPANQSACISSASALQGERRREATENSYHSTSDDSGRASQSDPVSHHFSQPQASQPQSLLESHRCRDPLELNSIHVDVPHDLHWPPVESLADNIDGDENAEHENGHSGGDDGQNRANNNGRGGDHNEAGQPEGLPDIIPYERREPAQHYFPESEGRIDSGLNSESDSLDF